MRKISGYFCCALAGLAIAAVSCQTDYSEEAADTARAYVMKHLKTLTEEQRHFVRYTPPVIYSNLIFPSRVVPPAVTGHVKRTKPEKFPVAPQQDFMHHCVVWSPPDLPEKIVVVGEGERSMRFWQPTRVILKNYIPGSVNAAAAKAAAVDHAMNRMLFLTRPELNRMRFSEPDIRYTRFPLTVKTAPVEKEEESAAGSKDEQSPLEKYLAKRGGKAEELVLTQLSLIWPADRENEFIAISGFSPRGCLYQWMIHSANYVTAQELKENTLSPEEIAAIEKDQGPAEGKIVFPPEPGIDRGAGHKESGSVFGGNLKF